MSPLMLPCTQAQAQSISACTAGLHHVQRPLVHSRHGHSRYGGATMRSRRKYHEACALCQSAARRRASGYLQLSSVQDGAVAAAHGHQDSHDAGSSAADVCSHRALQGCEDGRCLCRCSPNITRLQPVRQLQ